MKLIEAYKENGCFCYAVLLDTAVEVDPAKSDAENGIRRFTWGPNPHGGTEAAYRAQHEAEIKRQCGGMPPPEKQDLASKGKTL